MENKINIACFKESSRTAEVKDIWQWDYGQILRIQGLNLPSAVEIHFSLDEHGGEAVRRIGLTKDGVTDVPIPDLMVENESAYGDSYYFFAYIYLTDETSGNTEYKIRAKVSTRSKPEGYLSGGNDTFAEILKTVNEIAADKVDIPVPAKVGQVLSVKATDESGKPTEFEATDQGGGVSDEKIAEAVNAYLEEHPEATTTVQDGVITEAKLADDVKNKLGTSNDYKWIAKGQMREPVRDFQGWAHGVQFDKELGVAVCMIISGEGSHSNKAPYYRATIEPSTGYMSEYEEVKMYDADGNELTDCGYFSSFNILSDGTYIMTDYYRRFFTSDDKGYTWNYSHTVTMENEADNCTIWGITELSNGRWIASNGGHNNSYGGTFYSDDKGKTWTRVKTTTVTGAADAGWSFPEGVTPFEAVFIEIENGKVVQYARATNNGRNSSGTARANQEPALFSKSDDYGTTWTTFVCSAGITDMSCCNGKIVIKDGYVHFLYGSRRLGITDPKGNVRNGCMYYTKTTLENAYLDVWETPVIVDYDHWDADTAASVTDIGYPSLWLDNLGNLNGVYYDSAESTGDNAAYCANWRYLVGNPYLNQYLIKNESSGSKVVSYSQKKVDEIIASLVSDYETKISELDAKLTKKIAQIVISGGGSTGEEDDSTDGTMYVLSGLVDSWDLSNSENYDFTTYMVASEYGKYNLKGLVASAFLYNETYKSAEAKNIMIITDTSGNNATSWLDESAEGVTFEQTFRSGGTGSYILGLQSTNNTATMFSEIRKIYPSNGAIIVSEDTTAWFAKGNMIHAVITFTADTMTLYANGVATYTVKATDLGITEFDLAHLKTLPFVVNRQNVYTKTVRVYSKALTADEVANNFAYENKIHSIV